MDDPVRVCIQGSDLFARVEAQGAYSTEGVPLKDGEWMHVAAVKEGTELRLYLNGELKKTAAVPEWNVTAAVDFAIGANPHWTGGNETFRGRIDEFALYAQAFTADEIAALSRP
jgi:subtilase family serine protease